MKVTVEWRETRTYSGVIDVPDDAPPSEISRVCYEFDYTVEGERLLASARTPLSWRLHQYGQ